MALEKLIFYTGEQPIKEMLSSVDPAALGPGQFALLDNLTVARNKVTARSGCELVAAAPEPNASFRGAWEGHVSNQYLILAAFRVAGKTRIYRLNSFSWQEVTDASTRFATDGYCDFAPYVDGGVTVAGEVLLSKREAILVANNEDNPISIYYAYPLSPDWLAATVLETNSSPNVTPPRQTLMPLGFLRIKKGSTTTCVPTTGNFKANNTAELSDTENEVEIIITSSAAVGNSIEITADREYKFGDINLSLHESLQFHLIVEDSIDNPVFSGLRIYGYSLDHSDWIDLYVPGHNLYGQPIYTHISDNVYMASFPVNSINATNLSKFKFEIAYIYASTRTFRLISFLCGGNVPADSNVSVSFLSSKSHCESPRYNAIKIRNQSITILGANDKRNFPLPQVSGTFWAEFLSSGQPDVPHADFAIIYRQDPGDEFGYASWALSWLGFGFVGNVRPDQKDYGRKAPSDFTIPPPKAKCLAAGTNRLFAGGGSGERGKVYVSDEGYPMRFSSIPRDSDGDGVVDADSGTTVSFPGEEVQRIVPMPGSVVGIAPVAIVTNRNTWRLEGIDSLSLSRPTLMTPHGTKYPWTVRVHKGNLYFLDSERQPRLLAGGYDSAPLGIYRVEDQFEEGDPTNAYSVVWKERYYTAFRPPGSTLNRRVMVYEQSIDGWYRHTYAQIDIAGYLLQDLGGNIGRKLLAIANTGEVFEIEKPGKQRDHRYTLPLEDTITYTIKTGELHGSLWESVFFGRVGVLCDSSPAATILTTRRDMADPANPGQANGLILPYKESFDRAWRYDQSVSGARPCGIVAQACQLTVTGDTQPGKLLKGLFIEIEPATAIPDVQV